MKIIKQLGRLKLFAAALLVSVSLSSNAFADTGALKVIVTNESGNPVAGATVSASTSESLSQKSGVTDADGTVRLSGLDPSNEYVVVVTADGYQPVRNENVLVVTERTFNLAYTLQAGDVLEEVVTYGRNDMGQLVDTTSSLQATDVTLDIMDSLPTGRSYQSYLQMAPTTKPTPVENGNPSSKSGVNYSDVPDALGNAAGTSTDNVYYLDGVNITDNTTGTFGANFNSEIIQEQQIITGGVPAEYEGGQGLISRVISKSGSNEFHGSVNYYTQSDSLVADNKHLNNASFSDFDTAFTLGGPIVKDKLWFFTSFQKKDRSEDVIDPVSGSALRTVDTKQDLGFIKLTYQATENDKIVAEYFNDPYDRNGSTSTTVVANRDTTRKQGGDNYKFEYSHSWDDLILTANYVSHEGEISTLSADSINSLNDVAFQDNTTVTNVDMQLGGAGSNDIQFRNKDAFNLTLEYFLDTDHGSHEIKGGYSQITNERNRNRVFTGDMAQYTSIGDVGVDTTLDAYINGTWTGQKDISGDDYNRIRDAMMATDSAYYLGLLDSDTSGDISDAELGAMVFSSTAGNPNGMVNAYKIEMTEQGATNFKTEGDAWFIQDTWSIDDHWTVNAGVRAEKWDHIATDGSKVFTFDYEFAPRLSLVYDINGDGASKVWGFYGRYYDPIRTDMTAFAGTLTGSVLDEQIYAGDRWLSYRVRGGAKGADGFFAPTTKTPYTDEFMLGYERSLTEDQSISFTYSNRVTKDIMEDYDLGLYTDPAQSGDFSLPLSYFGFDVAPVANYFIATLEGGKREYQGAEVTWRKRRSNDSNWFGLVSYSYNDAKGNTNSDGNADFQGDVVFLDPRAPNMMGTQPGNIKHLIKAAGSYAWDNGFEAGLTYAWNSGTVYSSTWAIYGRHLPDLCDPYVYLNANEPWVCPGAIGGATTDSYGILNARAKYVKDFELAGGTYTAEFFLDIFNVLDNQAEARAQDLSAGDGVYSYGEANGWVLPRRFYLGARVSF